MKLTTLLSTAFVAMLFAIPQASADTIRYQTDFENPPFSLGNLVPQDGWANHSGSGELIQVISSAGGQAAQTVQGGGSREDASVDLGVTASTSVHTLLFDFDVIVGSEAAGANATTSYFAHFKDGGTGFNSRIFVTAPNEASNNFTFAIGETSSSTPAASFATDFTYGVSYNLSGGYNFNTGISTLSVDGGTAIDSTAQADPGEDLSAFALRQSGGNTSQTIDNLRVSSIPEPASGIVLMAFATGLFVRRRR